MPLPCPLLARFNGPQKRLCVLTPHDLTHKYCGREGKGGPPLYSEDAAETSEIVTTTGTETVMGILPWGTAMSGPSP